MPFLKQHVGDLMVGWIDDRPSHLADGAVSGLHVITAPELDISQRHPVVDGHTACRVRPHVDGIRVVGI